MSESKRLLLTQSEAKSWLDCEFRAHLAFERGIGREESPGGARGGGNAGHAALMGGYLAWRALGPVAGPREALAAFRQGAALAFGRFAEDAEERAGGLFGDGEAVEELRGELRGVWDGVELYLSEIVARDVERSFPLAVEQPFEVPILTGDGDDRYLVSGRGVVDLVLVDRSSLALESAVVRDHKFITTGNADSYDVRFGLDLQTRFYLYALALLTGHRLRDAQFGVVTQFGPSEPKANKDGTISTAKIATTRAIYEAACAKQEPACSADRFAQIREAQRRLAETLPDNLARWVKLHEYVYTNVDIDDARETLYQVARRVRFMRRGELSPVRNARSCSILRCDFQDACVLGGPAESVAKRALELGFVVKPSRHAEVDEARLWRPGVKLESLLSVPIGGGCSRRTTETRASPASAAFVRKENRCRTRTRT